MITVGIAVNEVYRHRFEFLYQLSDLLRDRGIEIAESPGRSDLLIIQDRLLVQMEKSGSRFIGLIAVYERVDSATLHLKQSRRALLQRPNVRLWLKETRFRDWKLFNDSVVDRRHHVKLLAEASDGGNPDQERSPEIDITAEHAEKIVAFPPIHMQSRFDPFRVLKPRAMRKRRIDVGFAGSVSHKNGWIGRHRKEACQRLASMDRYAYLIGVNRVFKSDEFAQVLRNCKMFLSPYGHGEYSWKDFEALYAGCVLLKPPSSHVVTSGFDLYAKDKYHVEVDCWFRNLEQVVESVADNMEHHEEAALLYRKGLLKASNPEFLADQFASLVVGAMQDRTKAH